MNSTPPEWPIKFLRWFCDPALVEDVEGDLLELYDYRHDKGQKTAKIHLLKDIAMLFRPGIIKNFQLNFYSYNIDMFKNYLISAYRNVLKYKGFSLINVMSLAIGIAACIMIYLFIEDEKSFDSFHTQYDEIYRLCEVQSFEGTNVQNVALSMPGMAPTMKSEFPEIKDYTRYRTIGELLVTVGDKKIVIEKIATVDSSFLNIFDFPLIIGDKDNALQNKSSIILSEEMAMSIYGKLDVEGEVIVAEKDQFIVSGVMANVPENSHLQFNFLVNIKATSSPDLDAQFGSNSLNTYFTIHEGADLASMTSRFPEYLIKYVDEDANDYYKVFLQSLSEVHLGSTNMEHDYNNYRKFNGTYLDIFTMVGFFIMIIAVLNFMNLTTARASNRAKEVGIRKTIGALRQQLFGQFMVETISLSLVAFIIGVALVALSLPLLNGLIDREIGWAGLLINPAALIIMFGLVIIIGLLAGLYPSLYISSFQPIVVLKGFKSKEKRSYLQSSLVVLQFSLALGMIVSTLVILQQLIYMKDKDIGFTKDHIMLVSLNKEASDKYKQMKEELLKQSNIKGVTASGQRLGNNFHQWGFKVEKDTAIVGMAPSNVFVDHDFLDVYGIKLLSGRSFSKDIATDNGNAYIINQSLQSELGFDDAVGVRAAHSWYDNDSLGSIIGVTEDFNFNSLHYKVNTLCISFHSDWGFNEMSVKVNGENMAQSIDDVERVYNQFVTEYPISYTFLDDHMNELYKTDTQMASVITIIAFLSIFIGCMGLFGLAAITIQRRTKEIGIRKVMGASTSTIMSILSKDFAVMILISFFIATPITYIFLAKWLEGFAYRIDINPLIFVLGGLISVAIALATISFHVIKAAQANPVLALKNE